MPIFYISSQLWGHDLLVFHLTALNLPSTPQKLEKESILFISEFTIRFLAVITAAGRAIESTLRSQERSALEQGGPT